MNLAVHGTELHLLLAVLVPTIVVTVTAIVSYVRISLRA